MRYGLTHLEHAVAVAEHRGFRSAAEALGISQPALSRSVHHLEKSLGVRLFDRGRDGVELTVYGRVVVERGRSLRAARLELERELKLLEGLEIGTLRVSLGPYPAALSGHAAAARLVAARPDLRVHAKVADWSTVITDVLERSGDLGIAEVSEAEHLPQLAAEPLVTRRGFFVCRTRHPLLSRSGIALDDLLEYPWACTRIPLRMGRMLARDDARAGRWDADTGAFVPALCLESVFDIGRMVVSSDVLAVSTLTLVEGELERGELAVLPFAAPWLRANYGFITRRGRTPSPVAEAFMAEVAGIEAEIDEREAALRRVHASGPSFGP